MPIDFQNVSEPSTLSADPASSLALSSRGNQYPNQFFDLGQQYMPPTIKELFRWCTFYYYNSPLISSTINKISRYPITDLILEDSKESVKELWEKILVKNLKMKDRLMEVNLDHFVYGNAFVSLHLPFTRFLTCKSCGNKEPIGQWKWSFDFSRYSFGVRCHKCGLAGPAEVSDRPYKDIKAVRLLRWNPENIMIKYNEYTGKRVYMYNVPYKLKNAIMRGDKDVLEDMPLIVLQAIRDRRYIRLNADNLFHVRRPTLAEQDQGWGKPLIIHVLKDMYYLYTLRRAQEAIALEHIVPFDILYPMPNAQVDPYMHTDLGSWRSQIENIIKRHRRDPNFKAVIPIPVGFGRLGGDGKAMMLTPELNYLNQTIVGGMGVPQEFLFGGLNFCLLKQSTIISSQGLVKLEEICPKEVGYKEAPLDLSVSTRHGVEKVALVHTTSEKRQYSIKTRAGLSLTGSNIHRLVRLGKDLSQDWITLEDIRPGDYVAVKRKSDLWGQGSPSLELCRLLGYLVAEGSTTEKRIAFYNKDAGLVADYIVCFDKVFGKRLGAVWGNTSTDFGTVSMATVETKDPVVIEQFRSWGMLHYLHTKEVPYIIRTAKKECVVEFLMTLFEGDGCIPDVEQKQSIYYASVSPELLNQVQLLLLNAGIVSYQYPGYEANGDRGPKCQHSDRHYHDNIPSLQIHSAYAADYMEQIGFVSSRKNNIYNESIPRDRFRCEQNKIPYLTALLRDLKAKTNGCGAWVENGTSVEHTKEVYSAKEAAELLGREVSSVLGYIRQGKLQATKEVRTDGRFSTFFIKREDIDQFLSQYGLSKRAAVGQTTWEINDNNEAYVNWETVQALDPELYERYRQLKQEDHIWEKVVETSRSIIKAEMCDLTVFNTHSYVANGIVSHNTGSSISLRTLENDFIQNRSQLLDLVYWIKDKVRVWLQLPDVEEVRFADFRMADDVQRNQQLIGLNAQGKISDQTLLTELGYNYDHEVKKKIEEIHIQNYINDLTAKGGAKSQGEASLIQVGYQTKLQEITQKAQLETSQRLGLPSPDTPLQPGQALAGSGQQGETAQQPISIDATINRWVTKLTQMDPTTAAQALMEIKTRTPELAQAVESAYNQAKAQPQGIVGGRAGDKATGLEPNMTPMPVQRAPTRAGTV